MKRKRGTSRAPQSVSPESWPAANVEMRDISALKLRSSNPNVHTLEQIEQICASMRKFGWTMPILIDEEDFVLAGEGRVRGGRLLGYTKAPCTIARGWSDAEKSAYVIADNQLTRNSEWDRKRLRSEVRGLVAAAFDVQLIGLDAKDLEKLVIDPSSEPSEPTEVTMQRCPTCGGLRRKGEK